MTAAKKTTAKASTAAKNSTKREKSESKAAQRAAELNGLTEEERAALNPQSRAPLQPTIDEDGETDANVRSVSEEEIAAAKGAKKVTLTSFLVKISPDPMTSLSKRVFEHEIPILQDLHGEDKIEVIEDSERDEEVTLSAQQEFDRLSRCYGPKGETSLQNVYSSPRGLANEMGLPAPKVTGSWRNRQAQSAQRGAGT